MFVRFASAATTGSLIAVSLLFTMQSLIAQHGDVFVTERPRHFLGLAKVREPEPVKTLDQNIPPLEKLTHTLQPPPSPQAENDGDGTTVGVSVSQQKPRIEPTKTLQGATDSPLVSMIRVQPVYPARALAQELEGFVIVQFDVVVDGSVHNVVVLQSSHSVFESAAVAAAQRFRFRPRTIDGVPVPSDGIRNRFSFSLEQSN